MEHRPATHPNEFKKLMLEERQKAFLLKYEYAYEVVRKLAAGFDVETRAYSRRQQGALWAVLHRVMGSNLPIAWYKKKTPEALAKEIGPSYWVFHLMTTSQVRTYKCARGYKRHLQRIVNRPHDDNIW